MTDISRKTYERNGIETIVDNDGILWLNEKHIEERLDSKNLVVSLLELILPKKNLIFLELSMKYLDILNNQLKKLQ